MENSVRYFCLVDGKTDMLVEEAWELKGRRSARWDRMLTTTSEGSRCNISDCNRNQSSPSLGIEVRFPQETRHAAAPYLSCSALAPRCRVVFFPSQYHTPPSHYLPLSPYSMSFYFRHLCELFDTINGSGTKSPGNISVVIHTWFDEHDADIPRHGPGAVAIQASHGVVIKVNSCSAVIIIVC